MRRFTKWLAMAVVVTIGLLTGSFETRAEETESPVSQSQVSCNDDAVRKMLITFALDRGITNHPVLGEAHIRGEHCEILLSTDSGRELGYVEYLAVGYKWFPVIHFYDWPNK
jgi:hypothetical protein